MDLDVIVNEIKTKTNSNYKHESKSVSFYLVRSNISALKQCPGDRLGYEAGANVWDALMLCCPFV